jgi:hypothetical protein
VQILVQDHTRNDVSSLLNNIAIISFNYDRSIPRALPAAIDSQFALDLEAAQSLAQQLSIFYPYGPIGSLPPKQ